MTCMLSDFICCTSPHLFHTMALWPDLNQKEGKLIIVVNTNYKLVRNAIVTIFRLYCVKVYFFIIL